MYYKSPGFRRVTSIMYWEYESATLWSLLTQLKFGFDFTSTSLTISFVGSYTSKMNCT